MSDLFYRRTIAVACALAGSISVGFAQSESRPASRDERDAERIIEELKIESGHTVAEIGAGDGELTLAIARRVGRTGRVYSTELGDDRVRSLERAIARDGVENVTVLTGHEDRTNLPEGCCDAIFMRNVYHHFADPDAMAASLARSLKPGGRLAVLDFAPRGKLAPAPAKRDEDGQHGVSAEAVAEELKLAGFDVLKIDTGEDRDVFVAARRP